MKSNYAKIFLYSKDENKEFILDDNNHISNMDKKDILKLYGIRSRKKDRQGFGVDHLIETWLDPNNKFDIILYVNFKDNNIYYWEPIVESIKREEFFKLFMSKKNTKSICTYNFGYIDNNLIKDKFNTYTFWQIAK